MSTTVTGDGDNEGECAKLPLIRNASPLRRQRGVWIFRVSRKISAAVTDAVLRHIRGRRDHDNHKPNST